MDTRFRFSNYHQHNAYPQYPHGQNPSSQSHDGTFPGMYHSYTPQTPAFSPGSSSTTPSTPVVPTPPPSTEDLWNPASQTEVQSTYGGWDGFRIIGPYGDSNLSLFQPHIKNTVHTDVNSDAHSERYSGAMLPRQCREPPESAPPLAAPYDHDHAWASATANRNHRPASATSRSRFALPDTASLDSIDEFRTRWDSLGNLVRTPVPTSCGYQDCTFVGLPDTLWKHIVETHHAGTTAKTSIRCGWDGCEPTNKPMMRRSLQRHILDAHLLYMKLHCPYCHYTSRDAEYAGRHGDDPAMCPERPAWEAHEGQGWARRDTCAWCQAITMIV